MAEKFEVAQAEKSFLKVRHPVEGLPSFPVVEGRGGRRILGGAFGKKGQSQDAVPLTTLARPVPLPSGRPGRRVGRSPRARRSRVPKRRLEVECRRSGLPDIPAQGVVLRAKGKVDANHETNGCGGRRATLPK